MPNCRPERAARRIRERLRRGEHGLLADDAGAAHFLDFAGAVGDDPVSREELDGLGTLVADGDRVEKEPLLVVRPRAVRGVLGHDRYPNAAGDCFGREHGVMMNDSTGERQPDPPARGPLCRLPGGPSAFGTIAAAGS